MTPTEIKNGERVDFIETLTKDVRELLEHAECIIYKKGALAWRSSNSAVTSLPAVDLSSIFNASKQLEVTANFVSIRGFSGDPPHYHTSHLIGVIIKGEGWLISVSSDSESSVERIPVAVNDVVFIPRGAYHIFECDPQGELDYIALEFSDQAIDYQKHWDVQPKT